MTNFVLWTLHQIHFDLKGYWIPMFLNPQFTFAVSSAFCKQVFPIHKRLCRTIFRSCVHTHYGGEILSCSSWATHILCGWQPNTEAENQCRASHWMINHSGSWVSVMVLFKAPFSSWLTSLAHFQLFVHSHIINQITTASLSCPGPYKLLSTLLSFLYVHIVALLVAGNFTS